MKTTANTGDQDKIYKLIEEYFNNIQKKIDSITDKLLTQNPR